MKKQLNKKKLLRVLLVLALILVAGTLLFLIFKGTFGNVEEEHDHEHESLNVSEMELMKSSENIFEDNDFLIESFNEYEDGDRFYLAGTNLIDYDRMFVFFNEWKREDIVEVLAWNYEEIKDKAEDDVLIVFMKGNVLMRLFNMKESECGFNFLPDGDEIGYAVQSSVQDSFFKTKVENGIKYHVLDEVYTNEDALKTQAKEAKKAAKEAKKNNK